MEEMKKRTASSGANSPETPCATNVLFSGLNANWKLSLTPKGLRIDTNIVSLKDLYDILLTGVSQLAKGEEKEEAGQVSIPCSLDLAKSESGGGQGSHGSHNNKNGNNYKRSSSVNHASSSSVSTPVNAVVVKHNPLYKSKDVTFPLYSAWESPVHPSTTATTTASVTTASTVALTTTVPLMPLCQEKDDEHRLLDHYAQCFLCFPLPDLDQFLHRCKNQTANPLLLNAILSWSARHAAIYHGMFAGQDPNRVGEHYFETAKRLLKEQFLVPNIDTAHALLLMYIYSIGKTGKSRRQAESEAYIFLGLAVRMCIDLGLHKEEEDGNGNSDEKKNYAQEHRASEIEREKRRRLFAAAEFLETLCSAHSDKPMMFPVGTAITTEPPRVMNHETGEQRFRTEFTLHRHKMNQIYRRIQASISVRDPLLSSVSALEKSLKDWYAELPPYFHYHSQREWHSTSFREQACLKLNFEYHFQTCQLYSIFLPHPDEQASAIALLSQRICLEAADAITEILECWAQLQQPWCHFTLDTLVMASVVYSNQLRSQKLAVCDRAKNQMHRIAAVLTQSPVRHHKYVRALIRRIKRETQEEEEEEKEQTEEPVDDEEQSSVLQPTSLDFSSLQQQQQPIAMSMSHPQQQPQQQQEPVSLPIQQQLQQAQQPSIDASDFDWLKGSMVLPGTPSIHSALDGSTPTDISMNELFRFADFIYTPIMDDPMFDPNAWSHEENGSQHAHHRHEQQQQQPAQQ
ncbi:hypothetical protein EC973_004404 [Apophysomyces ossiformis]|uniref:Xylanolytic transcriptional activator regulatory domain-containing protein n=1 Tax=Apophysomyces ossiformis TaxID=679940 RepID=A0A8H7BSS4_9FUNG|nr:hypothetical protein EC973_004404 [Apophysomyces ossiformis]